MSASVWLRNIADVLSDTLSAFHSYTSSVRSGVSSIGRIGVPVLASVCGVWWWYSCRLVVITIGFVVWCCERTRVRAVFS
ncbi:hypothetical protein HF521_019082 [Silurus meridionalis]|uniref:Uncharacterized protein n=1 Tax=Silurus meridionalis TaxID=175797 RepID=A0A8T0BFD9_SILME|nr:hypothetical protein HF521_019082 [Silurus meridionalis]